MKELNVTYQSPQYKEAMGLHCGYIGWTISTRIGQIRDFFRGILLLGSSLNWASSHKGVINQRAYFYLSNEGRMRFIGIMASDLGPFYSQK